MSSYDERAHDAIIFSDTPGLKDLIIRYKALFQSNKHPTCVGESQANCYSINIRNFRKPIVVTLNDDAGEEWDQMKGHSWIKSNTYRVIVNDTRTCMSMIYPHTLYTVYRSIYFTSRSAPASGVGHRSGDGLSEALL